MNRWKKLISLFPSVQKYIRKSDEIILTRSIKKDKNLFIEILNYFNENFEDTDFQKFSEVLYRIENNLIKKPVCKTCGKKLNFENTYRGYGQFCSRECSIQNKELKEKREQTCIEKYGGKTPLNSKEIQNKCKQTWLKKYGTDNPIKNKKIREKAIKTIKEKFGTDNVFKLKEFQEIAKQRRIEKYNTEIPLRNPFIKQKMINTNLKIYGTPYPTQNEKIKEKISQTCKEKYGVKWFTQTDKFKKIISGPKELPYLKNLDKLNKEFIEKNFFDENKRFLRDKFRDFFGYSIIRSYTILKHLNIEYNKQNSYSIKEKEILNFIKEIYSGEIIENSRKIISPYELDIFIPEKNLAIEFNGLLWHSEGLKNFKENIKYYHLEKTRLTEEKGINLLHIFENEWLDPIKQTIWKSIISYKLRIVKQRYFARKLEIKEVNNKEAKKFFEDNHIQGYTNAGIKIGLYDNQKLVSCMTFAKPRFNKNYQYELIRFASLKYSSCVGCAARLFKYFIKNYKPNSIISYANRRWASSLSNVYQKLGFKFLRETEPNYYYFKMDFQPKLYSRNRFQKHKLKNLPAFDYSLTESEIMFNSGYRRIYDAGNLVYEWKNKL